MDRPPDRNIEYTPGGPTIVRFHQSNAFVRGIMGPFGSSKSSACVMEILRRAQMQAPGPDGKRRTRWAIVRNSYPELKTTTIKTWGDWCPPSYGKLTFDSPIIHKIISPEIDLEVLFIALDRPEDVRKLLSLELTGAWLNEAREIPKPILDAMTGRVGRYPNMMMGGATWSGIIMDTNPPDDQSWWYQMAEGDTPENWEFFKQPSGLSPEAENIKNLPKDYYVRLKGGKDPDWVKVYVEGDYGFVTEGKPVYPMYRDSVHVSPMPIEPVKGLPLLAGTDFGLTPACIIGQKLPDGRWLILDEVLADGCGVTRFAELLKGYLAIHYNGFKLDGRWGDPAGSHRSESDERTALDIMTAAFGAKWLPAPTNDFTMRRQVVIDALNRMVDGYPGILISPKCKVLRKGAAGGYHFKFFQTGNGTQVHDVPNKNSYSHPHDALQYLLLGGGEHTVVLKKRKPNGPQESRIVNRGMDYDRFSGDF